MGISSAFSRVFPWVWDGHEGGGRNPIQAAGTHANCFPSPLSIFSFLRLRSPNPIFGWKMVHPSASVFHVFDVFFLRFGAVVLTAIAQYSWANAISSTNAIAAWGTGIEFSRTAGSAGILFQLEAEPHALTRWFFWTFPPLVSPPPKHKK